MEAEAEVAWMVARVCDGDPSDGGGGGGGGKCGGNGAGGDGRALWFRTASYLFIHFFTSE